MNAKELSVEATPIPGLLVVRLPVHEDTRGWFKEAWQREKMVALGLPDFAPVQANVSYNNARGATRGLHAEPWDKLVSVSTGRAFGAWVDLREGASFGAVFTVELDPGIAVFVPRGVANSYQTLTAGVTYSYLVNAHWRPGVPYRAVALDDPACGIAWPVPLAEAEVSEKDQANPRLIELTPEPARRPLILGADGQLGRALRAAFPEARGVGRDELDLTDGAAIDSWDWDAHDTVFNAAAYTRVDAAETPEGRPECWLVNALLPARLAALSVNHRFKLVHYSTDYVYDGSLFEHREDEAVAPLNVYGQSKAAGDISVLSVAPLSLILRTSWVVGDGPNFVRTMIDLAQRGTSPSVVRDQSGRLTFAGDLAAATADLVRRNATGLVNVSNGGETASWVEVARQVFSLLGRDPNQVEGVTTAEYYSGARHASRPQHSTLSLEHLAQFGLQVRDASVALAEYVEKHRNHSCTNTI